MVIKESQIRRYVRKCLREMVEDYPMDFDRPEELDGIFADAAQEEDDFYRDEFLDRQADDYISWQKENPYWDSY